MDAPQENLVPQPAHAFAAGSPAIEFRFGKPALMRIHFSWERA
jgi:hypothetical protein